ncbi:MAG TPA: DUF3102 domain-containing protein [Candidatus Jeotgalibaca merdavium]|uniref:DUF3102 domain-containing protein n=1 Tax=Candidatus Jeotgalibaca merdavium TaxID=2838627 RepID=A0A9D2I2Q1_9LACT|nr:DUF3102 domain-containing protein [Candidatus Jeotgalibaca merdavium]
MNELQLSDNLTIIETEIKSYQNLAGEAIFEIGRRLKHVKENDLVHGEFGKWLENVNLDRKQAYKFIKISEEFSNDSTYSHLGSSVLYQIATLPEPERTKEHVTSSGETKKPDEMTVRELRELKKQLKEERERNESLSKQAELANRKIEELEDAEPEVIERYMEPDDYQETKQALEQSLHFKKITEQRNEKLEQQIKEMEQQRDEITEKSQKYDDLNKAINHMNARLTDGQQKLKAQKEVHEYVKKANELIREVAPMSYFVHNEFILNNEYAKKPIEKVADDLLEISNKIKKRLNQGDVIDV